MLTKPRMICDTFFHPQIQLPVYIEKVRDRLAENLHEIWAMQKIEQGWSYGEVSLHVEKKTL